MLLSACCQVGRSTPTLSGPDVRAASMRRMRAGEIGLDGLELHASAVDLEVREALLQSCLGRTLQFGG